ncbi:MAG TPA: TadE family protein [Anaerolineales bacterium]|nr:TadE family protein [Anaerolineales bacterium]
MKRLRERITSSTAAGQAWVEFGLVLPVLLIVAVGLFDIGRAFYTLIVVTNASREGARYLALHPNDNLNSPSFTDTRNASVTEAQNSFITMTTNNVSVSGCVDTDAVPGCDTGTRIQVSVTHNYRPVFWAPFNITITRSTQMMVP